MGQIRRVENAGETASGAVVTADDEKGPAVEERKVAEALELAASARGTYQRLKTEFGNVAGAEASVSEARVALSALEPRSTEPGALSMISIGALGLIVWGAIGLGIAAIFSDWAKSFWKNYWLWVLVGFVLSGLLYAGGLKIEAWLRRASEDTSRKLYALVAIPGITVAIMGLIGFGSTKYVTIAAQLIIIPVTALLPAMTYFLFLATRRPSILNEFIGNLGRLGLLARRPGPVVKGAGGREESDEERRARVESYFQRFEAIYGALRFESRSITRRDLVDRLITCVETPSQALRVPQTTVFIGDLFHANLIIPIGLVTILTTLGWLLVLQPDFNLPAMQVADLVPKLTALNFAFLGAYFFGIQMLFRRFVRRDLGPNAYFAFSNRIILAVIGVWLVVATFGAFPAPVPTDTASKAVPAASAMKKAATKGEAPAEAGKTETATPVVIAAKASDAANADSAKPDSAKSDAAQSADGSGVVTLVKNAVEKVKGSASAHQSELMLLLAFTIGVFPRVVWQFLSAAATKLFRVKVVLPSVEAEQPLNLLDGLTVWHETRFEEEDIENVPNMASVDAVELMLHTQIPVERLVGWIDQAILLTALGKVGSPVYGKLRALGLRTATQVVAVANVGGNAAAALTKEVGAERLPALVLGLQKEVNFDLVSHWRQV